MRKWIEYGFGIVVAFVSAHALAADPQAVDDRWARLFVRTQAISERCQIEVPGLKPQLRAARGPWLSARDATELQAFEVFAKSKDGKKLARATDAEAFKAFEHNVMSAAATCIGLLKDYGVAYPSPSGTAVPAREVAWHLENFAPMVLAALKCARLDGIDVAAAPNGEEIWSYRGCGRVESVHVAPSGESWPMDGASADRLFAAMFD